MEIKINAEIGVPYYPKVKVFARGGTMQVWTKLRKVKNGIWYYTNFYKQFYVMNTQADVAIALTEFHRDVYISHILGEVDTDLVFKDGAKVFVLDENQESEKDRLMNELNL